jgi:hypothetical protein
VLLPCYWTKPKGAELTLIEPEQEGQQDSLNKAKTAEIRQRCGVEQWQLAWLITRRSRVRIPPPLWTETRLSSGFRVFGDLKNGEKWPWGKLWGKMRFGRR